MQFKDVYTCWIKIRRFILMDIQCILYISIFGEIYILMCNHIYSIIEAAYFRRTLSDLRASKTVKQQNFKEQKKFPN